MIRGLLSNRADCIASELSDCFAGFKTDKVDHIGILTYGNREGLLYVIDEFRTLDEKK